MLIVLSRACIAGRICGIRAEKGLKIIISTRTIALNKFYISLYCKRIYHGYLFSCHSPSFSKYEKLLVLFRKCLFVFGIRSKDCKLLYFIMFIRILQIPWAIMHRVCSLEIKFHYLDIVFSSAQAQSMLEIKFK